MPKGLCLTLSSFCTGSGRGFSCLYGREEAWKRRIWSGFCWQTVQQWQRQRQCLVACECFMCMFNTLICNHCRVSFSSTLIGALMQHRLPSSLSTEAAKVVAMVRPMSGLCTGKRLQHSFYLDMLVPPPLLLLETCLRATTVRTGIQPLVLAVPLEVSLEFRKCITKAGRGSTTLW